MTTQAVGTTGSSATQWDLDVSHSSAHFSVRHMMVTNVRGEIRVLVEKTGRSQSEKHGRHHQIARAEFAVEPFGIAQAS